MVRIMVGTLLEVGRGKRAPAQIVEILEKKQRSAAGVTAPAHALYLHRLYYQDITCP
jgi:tRNA pseudouridine38-40 synthase